METISQALFWVANSLLIPDILLLLLLFIRSLLLVGGIYNQYMTKRRNDSRLNLRIKELTPRRSANWPGRCPRRTTRSSCATCAICSRRRPAPTMRIS